MPRGREHDSIVDVAAARRCSPCRSRAARSSRSKPAEKVTIAVACQKHATGACHRSGLEFRNQGVEDAVVEGIRPGGVAKLQDVRGAFAYNHERQ
jgi:hypothetical protein